MSPLHAMSMRWARQQAGGAAIEFALVMPAFVILVIGGIYISMMISALASLHFAVEQGARCASVTSTVCSDANSTATFTQAHYQGPNINPAFSYSTGGCGHTVTGTATMSLNLGLWQTTIPVSAASCFP